MANSITNDYDAIEAAIANLMSEKPENNEVSSFFNRCVPTLESYSSIHDNFLAKEIARMQPGGEIYQIYETDNKEYMNLIDLLEHANRVYHEAEENDDGFRFDPSDYTPVPSGPTGPSYQPTGTVDNGNNSSPSETPAGKKEEPKSDKEKEQKPTDDKNKKQNPNDKEGQKDTDNKEGQKDPGNKEGQKKPDDKEGSKNPDDKKTSPDNDQKSGNQEDVVTPPPANQQNQQESYHTGGGYTPSGGYVPSTNEADTSTTSSTSDSSAGLNPIEKSTTSIDDIIKGNNSKYNQIPKSSTVIPKKSTSGGNSVIPIAAGIAAAAAAGIGAKAYIDRKNNNDNGEEDEENFTAEEWSEGDNLEIDYNDSSDTKEESLIDEENYDEYEQIPEEKYDARNNEEIADLQ